MFPLRDLNKTTNIPYVTYLLILANVGVFAYMLGLDVTETNQFYARWGAVPGIVANGNYLETIFTSMFVHAGWMHIIGNMLFLYVFGDNVEARLGRLKFILFYLIGGVGAFALHALTDLNSLGPVVGASGAIGAVLGGYLVFFPDSGIEAFFLLGGRGVMAARTWIMYWFIWQVLFGVGTISTGSGVAFFAHIGGFAAGWAMAKAHDHFFGGDNYNTKYRYR